MANFEQEILPLLKSEGGLSTNRADRGGITKFGISKKSYPDLDISRLTQDDAINIYKRDYWDAIGGDSLPPATAAVAFDAAVNHGVGAAKKLLQYSGGDPGAMLSRRKSIYNNIVKRDPTQKQFYNGWMNRLAHLGGRVADMLISPAYADETPYRQPDISEEDYAKALDRVRAQGQKQQPEISESDYARALAQVRGSKKLDPISGMSTSEKVLAGVGGAMVDLGMGAGQMVGLVSPEDVAEKRKLDKPLLDTTAGTVGNVVGNVATAIPTAFIPGANTVKGAALIGAGLGALQPAESTGEVLGNTAIGSAANAGGVKLGQMLTKPAETVVPTAVQKAAKEAIDAGYVIPPTQVNPTLGNRLKEGFSGKITTAQNASAKNQALSNELAKKAINAEELSPEGLAMVRKAANQSYDELGKVGKFKTDNDFHSALNKASEQTKQMLDDFPELENSHVTKLVKSLKDKGEFNAQSTIEAIKRLRADAATNKIALDPEKKGLGRAQSKVAQALEDLIDRNLQSSGKTELLENYRIARQTLAKAHDIEKILNPASGNIDANKLAAMVKKGKPLTGELKQVADFAAQFPKAAQMPEKMGSLPQSSPLDWATGGLLSAGTGNPAMMASVLARPAVRKYILSDMAQKALVKPKGEGVRLNKGIANKFGALATGAALSHQR